MLFSTVQTYWTPGTWQHNSLFMTGHQHNLMHLCVGLAAVLLDDSVSVSLTMQRHIQKQINISRIKKSEFGYWCCFSSWVNDSLLKTIKAQWNRNYSFKTEEVNHWFLAFTIPNLHRIVTFLSKCQFFSVTCQCLLVTHPCLCVTHWQKSCCCFVAC